MASIWDVNPPASNAFVPQGQAAQSPWYNGGNYGQSQDWFNTPIGQNIREQDKQLAFSSWANRAGVADNDNSFNRWFFSQFPRFNRGYGQATMDNPMMTIDQYLGTLPNYQQMRNEYQSQSPQVRGEQYSNYAPIVRWLNQ